MKSSGVKEEIGDENRRLARRQGFSPIHHGRGEKGKRASRLLQRSFQGGPLLPLFFSQGKQLALL